MDGGNIVIFTSERDIAYMEDYLMMLDRRNVQAICPICEGYGVKTYGSSAAWGGQVGGQTMTSGICDNCWGSGDALAPWVSLKKASYIREELDELVRRGETEGIFITLKRLANKKLGGRVSNGPYEMVDAVWKSFKDAARIFRGGTEMMRRILEDNRPITKLVFPDGSYYRVGAGYVTSIVAYPEKDWRPWFVVYKGDVLVTRVNAAHIEGVYYADWEE